MSTLYIDQKIKAIRLKNGLSQKRFGKKIGVSDKSISSYETGKCQPPLYVLDTISKLYDVTFFTTDENKSVIIRKELESLKDTILKIEDLLDKRLTL